MPPPPPARDDPYHIRLHDPRAPPPAFRKDASGCGGPTAAWQRMHMISALPHMAVTLPVRKPAFELINSHKFS